MINNLKARAIKDFLHEEMILDSTHAADVGKRRAGIFHGTSYADPCPRRAYLQLSSVDRNETRHKAHMWTGEAYHQFRERGALSRKRIAETPLIWDIVADAPVNDKYGKTLHGDVKPKDLPLKEQYTEKQWLDIVVSELDTVRIVDTPHFKGAVLVDYKTTVNGRQAEFGASQQHIDQLNIYNYLYSRLFKIEPLKVGVIEYNDFADGMKNPTRIIVELKNVDLVRDQMLLYLKFFKDCREYGVLPPRIPPGAEPTRKGYPHYSCEKCPFLNKCLMTLGGWQYIPTNWEWLTEPERVLRIS